MTVMNLCNNINIRLEFNNNHGEKERMRTITYNKAKMSTGNNWAPKDHLQW